MRQVSFIHLADLHLDAPFSSLADNEKSDIRREELIKCFDEITKDIRNNNIELFLISGDFFEQNYVRQSTINHVRNIFSEMYGTEIILYPGNHDPLGEKSHYEKVNWSSNVHILKSSQQVLYFEKYNTCIYNIGACGGIQNDIEILRDKHNILEKKNKGIMSQNITSLDDYSTCFDILLMHGTVDIPFEKNYNIITSKELGSLGMDYIALGHMHKYIRLKADDTLIINPGSPEPLGFDEEGIHGYIRGLFQVDLEGKKNIEVEFVPIAKRRYYNIDFNVTGCISNLDIINKLQRLVLGKGAKDNLYCITLTGFVPITCQIDIGSIVENTEGRFFYVKFKNQTSEQIDYGVYLKDFDIKGEFVRKMIDMLNSEKEDEKRTTLIMALQYGLQALEKGKVDDFDDTSSDMSASFIVR